MTKEEMIEHWTTIARHVLTAENHVINEWQGKLKEASESGDQKVINQVADAYVRAVAEECLKYEKFEE